MAHGHKHDDHHDHKHGEHCDHDHHRSDSEGFVARVKRHINRRFKDNILDTEDDHGHTVQTEFTGKNKAGAIAVAAMGLGAVIHGGMNIWRGINGYEDTLGEKHDPSALTTTVGASETLGGAAVMLRALTGKWRG